MRKLTNSRKNCLGETIMLITCYETNLNMTKNIEQYRWRRERENREIVEYVLFSSSVYLHCSISSIYRTTYWANEMGHD